VSVLLVSVAGEPWVTRFGDDGWSFNLPSDANDEDDGDPDSDGSGLPGRDIVGGAVARWMQATTGADAALASAVFNLPLHLAEEVAVPGAYDAAHLTDAVMVWSSCVGGAVPVDLAAAVFAVPVADILSAIDEHAWMFVDRVGGVSCIGHEGE